MHGLGSPGQGDVGGRGLGAGGRCAGADGGSSVPQLAHAIRMLLEFTDTAYEEARYSCGEGKVSRVRDPMSSAKPPSPPTVPVVFCPREASSLNRVGRLPQSPESPLLCPVWGETNTSFI